jgi:hypothetical protein
MFFERIFIDFKRMSYTVQPMVKNAGFDMFAGRSRQWRRVEYYAGLF